jgi:hypothetical protein
MTWNINLMKINDVDDEDEVTTRMESWTNDDDAKDVVMNSQKPWSSLVLIGPTKEEDNLSW